MIAAGPTVLMKLGGAAASRAAALDDLAAEVVILGRPTAIVHGGGSEVSALSRRLGLEPVFRDGVRITGEAEMDVVEMVLSGLMNKRLVRRLASAGVRAVGISGADGTLVTGERVVAPDGTPSRTATIARVEPRVVRELWAAGYTPVISPVASDGAFGAVNINADDVAFALAAALGVTALVFLSDVSGILIDGAPVKRLDPASARRHIASGAINGGMIPKVRNALSAVADGVERVVVGGYESAGDLGRMLAGELGTVIAAEAGPTSPGGHA